MEIKTTKLKVLLTGIGGGAHLHSYCLGPGRDAFELIQTSKLVLEFHRYAIIVTDHSMLFWMLYNAW